MGHVLLVAAAWVLARSDAVLHRTTRSLTSRHALAAFAFTPVATKADEAVELPNGCTYAKVTDGSGPVPKTGDVVAVRLRGLLESGAVFLDSFNEGGPILFELGSVVAAPRVDGRVTPGVDAAVAQMRAGEVGRLIVPYDAGYGPGLSFVWNAESRAQDALGPVRRDAPLREIELLRCRDVGGKFSGDGARVCCSDKRFPCPGPDGWRRRGA